MTLNPLHWSCPTLLAVGVVLAGTLVLVARPARGADPAPAPRAAELTTEDANARAALALSLARHQAAYAQKAKAALDAGCGACRRDLAAARAEARRDNKVLVVFVGGCGNAGQVAASAGAVPVQATFYPAETDTERRVVVIYPYRDGKFYFDAALPAGAAPDAIKAAIQAAVKKKDSP